MSEPLAILTVTAACTLITVWLIATATTEGDQT
jgi:hypothetical protein